MDGFVLHWPQLTWLALCLFSMGIACARYGQPKRDTYDLVDVLGAPIVAFWLLYMGGFFTNGGQ